MIDNNPTPEDLTPEERIAARRWSVCLDILMYLVVLSICLILSWFMIRAGLGHWVAVHLGL